MSHVDPGYARDGMPPNTLSLDSRLSTRGFRDSLWRAGDRRATAVPLTLPKVRQHGLDVAAKPFGISLASSSDFRKHRIELHRQPSSTNESYHSGSSSSRQHAAQGGGARPERQASSPVASDAAARRNWD